MVAQTSAVSDAPVGFKAVEMERALNGTTDEMSDPGYVVSLVGDKLRIENGADWSKRVKREQESPDPSRIKFKVDMATLTWKPGEGVEAGDGWIEGFDVGEFAGGLFWFSKDRKKRAQIDERNTRIVAKTSKGIFAVQALLHLMFWYSDLVEVKPTAAGWTTRVITSLHLGPRTVVQDSDRFLYSTSEYISTLETDGTQRELYRPDGYNLRLNSMVVRANGDVWAARSNALLRLRRKGDATVAQWFMKAP